MRLGADSLVDMARRACGRYSARITDIGDLDYDLIRPVLLKIESPEKLVSSTKNISAFEQPLQLTTLNYSINSNKHHHRLSVGIQKFGYHSSNGIFQTGI